MQVKPWPERPPKCLPTKSEPTPPAPRSPPPVLPQGFVPPSLSRRPTRWPCLPRTVPWHLQRRLILSHTAQYKTLRYIYSQLFPSTTIQIIISYHIIYHSIYRFTSVSHSADKLRPPPGHGVVASSAQSPSHGRTKRSPCAPLKSMTKSAVFEGNEGTTLLP